MTTIDTKLEADLAKADDAVAEAMSVRDDAVDALCAAQYAVDVAIEVWGPLHDRMLGRRSQSTNDAAAGRLH